MGIDSVTQAKCFVGSSPTCQVPTNASFSGVAAFAPTTTVTRSLSTTSANVALPAGATDVIRNTGSVDAYIKFGTTSGVAAATTDTLLPAGQAMTFSPGSNTFIAGITASGTGSLSITGGSGAPAMTGGGSGGGGGGGGAVTAAVGAYLDGWSATHGLTTDSACATDNGTCGIVALMKRNNQRVTSMIAAIGTPMQQTGGSVSIAGNLPGFASTPTFNIGTGGPSGYALEAGHIATVDTSTASAATNTAQLHTDNGAGGTGITQPTGGSGLQGWLSGIYKAVTGGGAAIPVTASNTSFGATGAVGAYLDGWSVTHGLTTDSACATDNGTCGIVALIKRGNQRITSLISAVGSPFQAGGSIGNASFGATPVAITPTDKGGTMTAGGTAQTAIASNSSRKGGWIQNPCSATESLFISTTTSATTTGASDDAELPACASFSLVTSGGVITAAVSVNAATTGHRWLAKEVQ
jgi:hypothetical protein